MEFNKLVDLMQEQFNQRSKNVKKLYEVEIDKDEFWNLYLDSFPMGTNEIFRTRREYDCSCCRHFIKTIGNAVFLKDGAINTIWDIDIDDLVFKPVFTALSKYIKSKPISNVYVTKINKIGTRQNVEVSEFGTLQFDHFYLEIPNKFIECSQLSEAEIKGEYKMTKSVFHRSLNEISIDSVETVLELIAQNSLYRGAEWKALLNKFLLYKKEFEKLDDETSKNNFTWENVLEAGKSVGKIRNHCIGTLLVNITEGMDLETAIKKYEKNVAPENYRRPNAIFTKKMLEDTKKQLSNLGYLESLNRRFATLNDISINNILFSNKDSVKRIQSLDIFDEMSKEVGINPKKFNRVEEITIDSFIKNILPTTTEVEVLFENKHANNLVSLIAPKSIGAKSMFKWNNAFSWAYSGNITDSSMKENVKAAGGKVDGDLRFSIQWNDSDEYNKDDYDAHCIEPDGNEIFFGCKENYFTGGKLDVDIIRPTFNNVAVENITWASKTRMHDGVYRLFVNNYSHRGGKSGFKAEIEFDGEIYKFEYNKAIPEGKNINVAEVILLDGKFSIKNLLETNTSITSKEIWNLNTNQFIPVSTIMYSPNYWDEQTGYGNKHYFFMLKDCINPEQPNGFYNEFIKEELSKHKRVMEALGSKLSVIDAEEQLSGLGFSSTKHNELVVKVKGKTERILKIKF